MALYSLYCADVPLRNCSLTHEEQGDQAPDVSGKIQNSDRGPMLCNHRLSSILQSADEKKTMSSMLRSGKDQNNERSESNSTLWHNFPLNYSQVLQVVSTFRAGSTVPTSAV